MPLRVAAATAEALGGNVGPPTPDEIEAPSTALQRNALDRARFEIGLATDEEDFETRRQVALDATNAFHDAEIERINALELSEEERQDQLEDNQLARERGIRRLTELDNTFTQTRLANERMVQEEIERTNAMRARAAERAEQEAQREAERQTRASERAEAEAQREAERQTQAEQRQAEQEQSAGIGLLRTDVQRAQFDLGLATDEDDFEDRRQVALDATNAFHDAEAERIDGLMLSETQLANLREANALARERAIHRLTTAENTFETQRIRAAERAEQEAERETERQTRASERAEAEAQREAERQRRAEERAEEQAQREAERQAEAEQREQERAEAEAQRQADREQSAGIGLLRTDVQRSQFELGFATDEADFEARRQAALDATNAFHDAEADRIDGLMLSEVELANLREANALARERAIDRITRTENTFETQRLRDAEQAARAAERANEEAARLEERAAREAERQREREQREAERAEEQRLRAAEREERERTREVERAQRERQRLAERQQREVERANEQRLREEMRTQERIDDLRDDAAEAEQDRQQRLVDLEQDTQNRITEIHRQANRDREDIERNFQDAYQDIRRELSEGAITQQEATNRLFELGRERGRDLRELDIGTERSQEDVLLRQSRGIAEINNRASEATAENTLAINALTAQLQGGGLEETTTAGDALMATGDPATSPAEASAMAVENTGTTAENTTEISEKLDPITEISGYNAGILQTLGLSLEAQTRSNVNLEALVNTLGGRGERERIIGEIEELGAILPDVVRTAVAASEITTAPALENRMMMAGEPVSAQMMQAMNVSISAQNVTVSGGNVGSGGGTPEMTVVVQPQDVVLDNQKVGQVVGNTIVQQGANRRNLLGQ